MLAMTCMHKGVGSESPNGEKEGLTVNVALPESTLSAGGSTILLAVPPPIRASPPPGGGGAATLRSERQVSQRAKRICF